jgi:hypothetical protein
MRAYIKVIDKSLLCLLCEFHSALHLLINCEQLRLARDLVEKKETKLCCSRWLTQYNRFRLRVCIVSYTILQEKLFVAF